ncbi:GNAT family N-acetyltransferase [Actinomycetaceae bacterium L2_0104]
MLASMLWQVKETAERTGRDVARQQTRSGSKRAEGDGRLAAMHLRTLRTRRLELDIPSLEDVDEINAICQDEQIQKWTTVPVPYTRDDAAYFVENIALAGWEKGSPTWFIREASQSEEDANGGQSVTARRSPIVGAIGLTKKDLTAEIGYWLAPRGRGKGIMGEAVQAALDFAFDTLQVESVQYECFVIDGETNWPSAKVAWRAGFTFEGLIRKSRVSNRGIAVDSLHASILPSDPREPSHAWFGPTPTRPAMPDSRDPEALVRQFHDTYDLPVVDDGPTVDRERVHMRMGLVAEEFAELVGAVYGVQARESIESAYARAVSNDDGTRDTVEAADALGDLVYVIYGMALETGIPMRDVLAEIQASNLSKLGADGRPIYRGDGKVLKGPDFFSPDIRKVLGL